MNKKPEKYSYTMLDTYNTCPKMFELYYRKNLVKDELPSHFFFGSAIDDASDVIFREKLRENPVPFCREEMIKSFIEGMSTTRHLGEIVEIPTNPKVKYSKGQIQLELLDQDNIDDIFDYAEELGKDNIHIESFVEICQSVKGRLPETDQKLYNLICWHTFVQKGIMMLDHLKKWSDENIKSVISIQKNFTIEGEDGSILGGKIDLEAELMDNIERTLDLKTATNPATYYPDNVIETALQLHIYSEATRPQVGYVILDKTIRKKTPRVRERVIFGEVMEEMLDSTFDFVDNTIDKIRKEEFPMNKDSCFKYGKCAYYDYCHKGIDKDLVNKYKNSHKKGENNVTGINEKR